MRLNFQQLRNQLRTGIGPLYLVSADDPLLSDEALDLLRAAARAAGCSERQVLVAGRGFDWDGFVGGLAEMSLFAERQLVELRLPTGKPGDKGARALTALAGAPPIDKLVVVVAPAITGNAAKARWVRALADGGAWVALRAPSPSQLPGWLAARLKDAGLRCEPEALELLAARVEGNLLAAKQEIDKLVLLAEDGVVTCASVQASVGDGARFDVFQLADAALRGDVGRSARVLLHLEREGVPAPLALWALTREIAVLAELRHRIDGGEPPGRALSAAGVWRSREALMRAALERFDSSAVSRLLRLARDGDRIVKGARRGQPWGALMELTLALAGGRAGQRRSGRAA